MRQGKRRKNGRIRRGRVAKAAPRLTTAVEEQIGQVLAPLAAALNDTAKALTRLAAYLKRQHR